MIRRTACVLLLSFVGCSVETDSPPKQGKNQAVISKNELRHQRDKDQQVVDALADAGSDLTKPHEIEHHFVCDTRAEAEPILAWGEKNGFRLSEVSDGEHEGRKYVYFDLIKLTVPTIENVFADTSVLLRLAAKHGVEYDGWGCSVEK